MMQYDIVSYNITLYDTVWDGMIQYGTVWYNIILYNTQWDS